MVFLTLKARVPEWEAAMPGDLGRGRGVMWGDRDLVGGVLREALAQQMRVMLIQHIPVTWHGAQFV